MHATQLRAAIVAALVVASTGTVALAGTAAADVTGVTTSQTSVYQGDAVTVTVENDTGASDVTVVASTNGTYEPGIDFAATATADADGTTQLQLDVPAGADPGDYTVYAAQAGEPNDGSNLDEWSDQAVADLLTVVAGSAVGAADADANLTSARTYWQGQSLFFKGTAANATETFQIWSVADDGSLDSLVTEVPLDSNAEAVIDTGELPSGTDLALTTLGRQPVRVGGDGRFVETVPGGQADQVAFLTTNQSFGAELQADSVLGQGTGDDVTAPLAFSSNRGSFDVHVTWETDADATAEGLAEAFAAYDAETRDLDDDGTAETLLLPDVRKGSTRDVDFSGVAPGAYNFTFAVADTGATAADGVEVQEVGPADAEFPDGVYTEQRGDVASITVTLRNQSEGTVSIGDRDVNYLVNATVRDGDGDGEVTVEFDTYATSQDSPGAALAAAGDEDEVTAVEQATPPLDDPIEAGDYPLSVAVGGTETDVATLVVEERATGGAVSWVAPATLDGTADLAELLGQVSRDDALARGDLAVAQFNASGLEGYFDDSQLDGSDAAEGLRVAFEETDPEPNTQPRSFVASDDYGNVTVVSALENDTFFVLWDTGDVDLRANDEVTYNATFAVNAANNNVTAENQSATTQFTVEPAEVTLNDGEDVTVPQGNATVGGETNLASGTELTVRARSTGESPFLETGTASVERGGTFNASFDFGGVANGTNFSMVVQGYEDSEIDGTVIAGAGAAENETNETADDEATDNATADNETADNATVDNETADNATVDNETTTTTTTTVTTTPANETGDGAADGDNATDGGGQPGFGVGVAVVAVVAAALLALRRTG